MSQTNGNLYIANVEASDKGNYSCFVSSPSITKSVFSKFIPLIPQSDREYLLEILCACNVLTVCILILLICNYFQLCEENYVASYNGYCTMLFSFPDTEVQIIPIHSENCVNSPRIHSRISFHVIENRVSSPESLSLLCDKPLYSSQNL